METNRLIGKVTPSITKMIRMDHSHVLLTFHKYEVNASPGRKKAIVDAVCLALDIHAQLEEEIFYPALEAVANQHEALAKARPEHEEIKRLIAELRTMRPGGKDYDGRFMDLMGAVLHHVADEETVLLPAAEMLLHDRLGELGAAMTRRRIELAAPHAGEMAINTARAMPASTLFAAGGLLAGGYLLGKAFEHRRH